MPTPPPTPEYPAYGTKAPTSPAPPPFRPRPSVVLVHENYPPFRSELETLHKERTKTFCEDCEQPAPTTYIVADYLWHEYGNKKGRLCINCFERRLGRPLTSDDFECVPVNDVLFFGVQMGKNKK